RGRRRGPPPDRPLLRGEEPIGPQRGRVRLPHQRRRLPAGRPEHAAVRQLGGAHGQRALHRLGRPARDQRGPDIRLLTPCAPSTSSSFASPWLPAAARAWGRAQATATARAVPLATRPSAFAWPPTHPGSRASPSRRPPTTPIRKGALSSTPRAPRCPCPPPSRVRREWTRPASA